MEENSQQMSQLLYKLQGFVNEFNQSGNPRKFATSEVIVSELCSRVQNLINSLNKELKERAGLNMNKSTRQYQLYLINNAQIVMRDYEAPAGQYVRTIQPGAHYWFNNVSMLLEQLRSLVEQAQ
jgi:hypothetical protein